MDGAPRRARALLLGVALGVCFAPPAHAQPGGPADAGVGASPRGAASPPTGGASVAVTPPGLAPAPPVTEFVPSYRWQIVGSDLIALGLVWLGVKQAESNAGAAMAELAVGTYFVGAPAPGSRSRRPRVSAS